MRFPKERKTTWLPSTEQLMIGSERAILASLDANLELAIRSLKAEHVALLPDGRLSSDPDYEPFTYRLLPVAESLVLCAQRLHHLVADYCRIADSLLATSEGGSPDTKSDDRDDEVVDDADTPF